MDWKHPWYIVYLLGADVCIYKTLLNTIIIYLCADPVCTTVLCC